MPAGRAVVQERAIEAVLSDRILSLYDPKEIRKLWGMRTRKLKSFKIDWQGIGLVLDAGCGPGIFGHILSGMENQVVGVDISKEAVRYAVREAKTDHLSYGGVVADLTRLPFRPQSFDACVVGWVLHHFASIDPVLSEIARILKPNGVIAVTEPNELHAAVRLSRFLENRVAGHVLRVGLDTPNRSTHTAYDYERALSSAGFYSVQVDSITSGEMPVLVSPFNHEYGQLASLLWRFVLKVRQTIFLSLSATSSGRLSGTDLLLTARKAPAQIP